MQRFPVCLLLLVFSSACKSQSLYSDEDYGEDKKDTDPADTEWEEDVQEMTDYALRTIFRIDPYKGFTNTEPVPGCSLTTPTEEEKEALINAHNRFRRKVAKGLEHRGYNGSSQPKAKNMFALGYSDTIEKMAAKWASMCNRHFKDHYVTDDYGRIWQSLLYHTTTQPEPPFDFASTVEHRFETHIRNFYGPDAIQPFNGFNSLTKKDLRSFAVMVTQGVRSIGCAQSSFHNVTENKFHRIFVCNYAGEFGRGIPLYAEGEPCADIPPYNCDNGLITVKETKGT